MGLAGNDPGGSFPSPVHAQLRIPIDAPFPVPDTYRIALDEILLAAASSVALSEWGAVSAQNTTVLYDENWRWRWSFTQGQGSIMERGNDGESN